MKRSIHIGNAVSLFMRDKQLVIAYPPPEGETKGPEKVVPIEDLGFVILDEPHIRISHALIGNLLAHNVALVTCDEKHMPTGMMLNLNGHSEQTEIFRSQVESSLPLRKNLWAQVIKAKIRNQAEHMRRREQPHKKLLLLAEKVTSGDMGNLEGRAAAVYWEHIFGAESNFRRHRFGEWPNNLLNYGYAIVRAVVARSLVGSGLMPMWGLHHRNKYNAYCLADDMMEPFRPFVDAAVCAIMEQEAEVADLTPALKRRLLEIPQMDVTIQEITSPIQVAATRSSASLVRCFAGELRQIAFPEWRQVDEDT
jgi:CRISP-associated protein Cas1